MGHLEEVAHFGAGRIENGMTVRRLTEKAGETEELLG
jgi:hypothetical protein